MKGRNKLKRSFLSILLILGAYLFLFIALIWLKQGNWLLFVLNLGSCIIIAMLAAGYLVCMNLRQKLDERFDRLEKLLGDRHQRKEEKTIEKNIDKSAKA